MAKATSYSSEVQKASMMANTVSEGSGETVVQKGKRGGQKQVVRMKEEVAKERRRRYAAGEGWYSF